MTHIWQKSSCNRHLVQLMHVENDNENPCCLY